jgi:hypothetical protein
VEDNLTYTILITNLPTPGLPFPEPPIPVVSVADNLSGSVESISASPGCTEAGGILSCEVLDLAPGASIALEIVVRPTQCGTITNTVTIEDSDPIDRFYSSSV